MKSVILEFITASTTGQPVLQEQVTAIYKNLFEQAATDINKKQIAADPGTCSQGIVKNEILSNDKSAPNGVVGDLMNASYASRFGQEKSVVEPGRSSTGIGGGLNNENINASVCNEAVEAPPSGLNVREATYDEFIKSFAECSLNETGFYFDDDSNRVTLLYLCMKEAIPVWKRKTHAYTIDGLDLVCTVPTKDGTPYIYAVYTAPEHRGKGYTGALMRKAIADAPNGISLHTHINNNKAKSVYEHYGFKVYPTTCKHEWFMATKPGIGGREIWDDTTDYSGETEADAITG